MRVLLAATAAFLLCGAVSAQDGAGKKADSKPDRPTQSSVAAKGAFGTVKADDAKVKTAAKASDLEAAKKKVGKTATFTGTVDRVFTPKGNGLALLNFAKDYRAALTGVVGAKDFAKLPDLQTLVGKKVMVSGMVEDYKGQPQVRLDSADDIKVIP